MEWGLEGEGHRMREPRLGGINTFVACVYITAMDIILYYGVRKGVWVYSIYSSSISQCRNLQK
jgi:hypothetical protein